MVAFFLEVGLLLMFVPWSAYWERNYFALAVPWLRPIVVSHYFRGAISGVGLLNILAGFSELAPVYDSRK